MSWTDRHVFISLMFDQKCFTKSFVLSSCFLLFFLSFYVWNHWQAGWAQLWEIRTCLITICPEFALRTQRRVGKKDMNTRPTSPAVWPSPYHDVLTSPYTCAQPYHPGHMWQGLLETLLPYSLLLIYLKSFPLSFVFSRFLIAQP